MKYIIIIFVFIFSFMSLAPNMQGAQYLKVGKMIHHFTNHHQKNGITFSGFIEFIKEHYSKNSDKNSQEHKDLPFKTVNSYSLQLSLHENTIFEIHFESKKIYSKKSIFSEPNFANTQKLASIWNPPQIV